MSKRRYTQTGQAYYYYGIIPTEFSYVTVKGLTER